MRPNRDQWAALLLLGVAGLYLWGTFQYGDEGPPGMPTARTFPLLLDGALAVLALVLGIGASLGGVARPQPAHGGTAPADSLPFGQGERQASPALSPAQEPPGVASEPGPSDGSALRRVALVVALLAGYLAALPRAGFLVSTVALGTMVQSLFFSAAWTRSLFWSAVITLPAYWIFTRVLQVPLP